MRLIDADELITAFPCGESIRTESVRATINHMPTIEVGEDCISREYLKSFEYINKGDFNSVETIREWIDNAPSVVPSRAEGEWVHLAGIGYRCSNCNEYTKSEKPFHKPKGDYCPNCGAKMKGAE